MALHTYTPTEWKNAPDHKTTPVNATNLNNIETGIENAYTDIGTVDTAVGTKANKADLTNIDLTGTTNTTGSTIASRTYFYLNGTLVRAKTAIASGATFTLNTNYEAVTAGALNELNSEVNKGQISVTADGAKTYITLLNELYALIDFSKIDSKSMLKIGRYNYVMQQISSSYLQFILQSVTAASISTDLVRISSASYIYSASIASNGTVTINTSYGTNKPASGTNIELYY